MINKVSLHVRVKNAEGKRVYCPPVYGSNKKPRAGWALVEGSPEPHPEAVFALRYTDRGKRVWEQVGRDPAKAITAKLRREHIFTGRAIGKPVSYDPTPEEPIPHSGCDRGIAGSPGDRSRNVCGSAGCDRCGFHIRNDRVLAGRANGRSNNAWRDNSDGLSNRDHWQLI